MSVMSSLPACGASWPRTCSRATSSRTSASRWASATATVVLTVLDEDAAKEICRELMACRPDAACGVLLNQEEIHRAWR
jgi:hypothetical protein